MPSPWATACAPPDPGNLWSQGAIDRAAAQGAAASQRHPISRRLLSITAHAEAKNEHRSVKLVCHNPGPGRTNGMRETIEAALAILAASAILWAVDPARAEVQDSDRQTITECASEAGVEGYSSIRRNRGHRSK